LFRFNRFSIIATSIVLSKNGVKLSTVKNYYTDAALTRNNRKAARSTTTKNEKLISHIVRHVN
jgi:hypothetical protein